MVVAKSIKNVAGWGRLNPLSKNQAEIEDDERIDERMIEVSDLRNSLAALGDSLKQMREYL